MYNGMPPRLARPACRSCTTSVRAGPPERTLAAPSVSSRMSCTGVYAPRFFIVIRVAKPKATTLQIREVVHTTTYAFPADKLCAPQKFQHHFQTCVTGNFVLGRPVKIGFNIEHTTSAITDRTIRGEHTNAPSGMVPSQPDNRTGIGQPNAYTLGSLPNESLHPARYRMSPQAYGTLHRGGRPEIIPEPLMLGYKADNTHTQIPTVPPERSPLSLAHAYTAEGNAQKSVVSENHLFSITGVFRAATPPGLPAETPDTNLGSNAYVWGLPKRGRDILSTQTSASGSPNRHPEQRNHIPKPLTPASPTMKTYSTSSWREAVAHTIRTIAHPAGFRQHSLLYYTLPRRITTFVSTTPYILHGTPANFVRSKTKHVLTRTS